MSTSTGSSFVPRGDLPPHVLDGLPMPVVLSRTRDDVVIRVNPEYSATYGTTENEAVGLPFGDIHWAPEDRTLALEHQRGGSVESAEVRIRTADGQCRWAQTDISVFEYLGTPVYLTTLLDVGLKKTAERELEASMAALREMARFPEMNPGPVARLDVAGRVLGANGAARTAFGHEDLEGRCLWDLLPDLTEEVQATVLAEGEPVRMDVHVGASWFALTLRYEPNAEHIFVYGTDISAQKAAEKELEERARFPQMNPGPVARLQRDGTVYRANLAASRVFGSEEIRGSSFRDLCRIPDDVWERIVSSGQPVQHEVEVGPLWLSFTLVHEPISGQVFAYGSDVTELKAAERVLAELARFPDMNPGPVLRLSRDGAVVLANRAALELFHSDDLTGRSWLELCPGVDQVFWGLICDAAEPVAFETQIGQRHFMLHHAPGPEGTFIFVYGSDLTAQKQAESALRQSEKMATLGTLTAGMAHELNNPAAASQRAAEQLEIAFKEIQTAHRVIRTLQLDQEAGDLLEELDREAREVPLSPVELGALERGDREADVEEWLEDHGVDDAWDYAAALVEIGHTVAGLDDIASRCGREHAGIIVTWQAQCHEGLRVPRSGSASGSRREPGSREHPGHPSWQAQGGRRRHQRSRSGPSTDRGLRQRAQSGVDQPARQRGGRHGRCRTHHRPDTGRRRRRGGRDRGRRAGYPRGHPVPDLRCVLHHQTTRQRHGARFEHQLQRCREEAWRHDRRGLGPGTDLLHRPPPATGRLGCRGDG
ncbi:MAG: PAS domain-containing protein [Gemmatimonadota bacterium]